MIGHLQNSIVTYLRGVGRPRSVADVLDALRFDHDVTADTVRHALWRMERAGVLHRHARGLYGLGQDGYAASCDQLLVAGVLDRLAADYGDALAAELMKRGWRR